MKNIIPIFVFLSFINCSKNEQVILRYELQNYYISESHQYLLRYPDKNSVVLNLKLNIDDIINDAEQQLKFSLCNSPIKLNANYKFGMDSIIIPTIIKKSCPDTFYHYDVVGCNFTPIQQIQIDSNNQVSINNHIVYNNFDSILNSNSRRQFEFQLYYDKKSDWRVRKKTIQNIVVWYFSYMNLIAIEKFNKNIGDLNFDQVDIIRNGKFLMIELTDNSKENVFNVFLS